MLRWLALVVVVVTTVAAARSARAGEGDETAALTVNGVTITVGAVESEYRWIFNQRQMFHPVNDAQRAACRREAVERVVVWELVRQKLAADGKTVTPAEVDAQVGADRARSGDFFPRYIAMLGQDEQSSRRRSENIMNFKRFEKDYIAPSLRVGADDARLPLETEIAEAIPARVADLKKQAAIKYLVPRYQPLE